MGLSTNLNLTTNFDEFAKPSLSLSQYGFSTSKTLQRLWSSRGKVLTKQGYYEAALASFDSALRIQPNHTESWIFRGVVLTHLGQYKSALASFDRALQLIPDCREVWIFRGAILAYLGRSQESRTSYSMALHLQQQCQPLCHDYPLWLPLKQNKQFGKSA